MIVRINTIAFIFKKNKSWQSGDHN